MSNQIPDSRFQIDSPSDEISLKDLILKIGEWWRYLKTQWWKILIAGFLGGAIGFVYASMQPITYTAKITFVVEEGKSGGSMGGLASLAGQFGVDMGGGNGGGLLSGDNILLYFKSSSLAREVLLSKFDSTSNKSIADIYSEVYNLKQNWKSNKKIGEISFPISSNSFVYSRIQDSLLQKIVNDIISSRFLVAKTDKKAGFIEISTTMENEFLAKIYCEKILQIAVNRYLNVKTQRQKSTVDKLQKRVDSIAVLLGQKTASSAALQTTSTTMDINPLYKTGTSVAVETTFRDKTMLSTIFASVIQNLELAKFTLSQETPVIQIIDSPFFPLQKNKTSKLFFLISFSLVCGIFLLIILVIKRIISIANN